MILRNHKNPMHHIQRHKANQAWICILGDPQKRGQNSNEYFSKSFADKDYSGSKGKAAHAAQKWRDQVINDYPHLIRDSRYDDLLNPEKGVVISQQVRNGRCYAMAIWPRLGADLRPIQRGEKRFSFEVGDIEGKEQAIAQAKAWRKKMVLEFVERYKIFGASISVVERE